MDLFKKICLLAVRKLPALQANQNRGIAFTLRNYQNDHPAKIVNFKLADIGEGIREVTVKAWFVNLEQYVNQFDDVCEVESDKASVTITSRYEGIVKKLHYNVGDVALVGSSLIDIEVKGGGANITSKAKEIASLSANVADGSDSFKVVTTIAGDSDDNSEDVTTIAEDCNDNSEDVTVGDAITADYNDNIRDSSKVTNQLSRLLSPDCAEKKNRIRKLATPAVRRISKENDVEIGSVRGTGKDGRVTKDDILAYLAKNKKKINSDEKYAEKSNTRPLVGYGRVMMKTMTESNRIPTLVLTDEIDVTNLNAIRNQVKNQFLESVDLKITLLPFFVKIISLCLESFPILNSSLDEKCDNYTIHAAHNIGVAIDTPMGLAAPNVKNVRELSIMEIASQLKMLQTKASEGKLSVEDVAYGTFTLSNIGSIAGTSVRPLILPPQVGILGLGRIQRLPRYNNCGELASGEIIHASWAADHRIVDGATVARFSNKFKNYVENPHIMLLECV